MVIRRGATWRDLIVEAYGPVLDLRSGGNVTEFYDYVFQLRFSGQWRIRSVVARHVGSAAPMLRNVGNAESVGMVGHALH